MAYSFRITEEYCQASIELEQAGYCWMPRPGDWMLDRDDASVGMLTLPVQDPAQVRRLNTHIPTYVQVNAMLDQRGVRERNGEGVEFLKGDQRVAHFSREEYAEDEGLCRLRALVAAYLLRANG